MKLVPTSFTFLDKEVDNISIGCTFGHHLGCINATERLDERGVDRSERGEPCDCRCHEISSCPLCGEGPMQLAELAEHMFYDHGETKINDWGQIGLTLAAIHLGVPPEDSELKRAERNRSINLRYTILLLDWFWPGPHSSDELSPLACKMCSWEYVGCKGRQPIRDEILESHLIERHGWKREIPRRKIRVAVFPFFVANPFDFLTLREPIDPHGSLELALAVIRMHQSRGDEEWTLFHPDDLAPFIPEGATVFGALKTLTELGWVIHLRNADYKADPSLVIECLSAGLGKDRLLKRD